MPPGDPRSPDFIRTMHARASPTRSTDWADRTATRSIRTTRMIRMIRRIHAARGSSPSRVRNMSGTPGRSFCGRRKPFHTTGATAARSLSRTFRRSSTTNTTASATAHARLPAPLHTPTLSSVSTTRAIRAAAIRSTNRHGSVDMNKVETFCSIRCSDTARARRYAAKPARSSTGRAAEDGRVPESNTGNRRGRSGGSSRPRGRPLAGATTRTASAL